MIEVGRVCVKTVGREAGRKCVVVDLIDDNFVVVTGPMLLTGVKRRRVSVKHLKPTEFKVGIRRDSADEAVMDALEKSRLTDVLRSSVESGTGLQEV